MPSTTTSSLTIGSIFDLIGPGSPITPIAPDQPGFDSLLQSPPLAPPQQATDQPPLRADQAQRGPAATETAPNDTHSPPDHSQPDDTHDQSPPQNAAKNQPPADAASPPPSDRPPAAAKQSQAESQVDAQSLAAIAALSSAQNSPHPAPEPDGHEEAPSDPAKPIPTFRPVPSGNRTVALSSGPANPQSAHAAGDSPQKAADEKANTTAAPTGAAQAAAAANGKPQAAADKARSATAPATDQTAGEKTVAVDPLLVQGSENPTNSAETAEANTASSQDHHREGSHSANDAASPNLESRLSAITADIASTGQAPIIPPAIAPLAAQTHLPDTLPSQPTGQASTSIQTNAATGQRTRLPADVLAPAAQTTNRRANGEIDATRLLTRVARAVTTAQERDGEVRLRLSPPELGSLRLDVKVQDGALVAHLQTETDAARTAILDNLPALRDRLADQGVRIERFDVDLMQRQPGGTADQPGGRQQEPLPPQARVVLPLRVAAAPAVSTPSVTRTSTSPDGLNVIV